MVVTSLTWGGGEMHTQCTKKEPDLVAILQKSRGSNAYRVLFGTLKTPPEPHLPIDSALTHKQKMHKLFVSVIIG